MAMFAGASARMPMGLALVVALMMSFAWLNSVPTDLTPDDRAVFAKLLSGHKLKVGSFDDQLATIQAVQQAAADAAVVFQPIPLDQSREPTDILREQRGVCYDRSRLIEKGLEFLGLETRHVSIFVTTPGHSSILTLLTPGVPSHALTEVKTARGWMLVDSIVDWVGLTASGRPLTADMLSRDPALAHSKWDARIHDGPDVDLTQPFVDIVGLYSRNGRLFWPYISFPDVNWTQTAGWLIGAA